MFLRRFATPVALAALASVVVATAVTAAPTRRERASAAAGYVVSQRNDDGSYPGLSPIGSTADAVVSLVAARRGPRPIRRALDYLEAHVADRASLGQTAKLVLAAVAGGRNPRSFGGVNLVREIRLAEQDDGQYGEHTPQDPYDGEVTNHALAMLGLAAAPRVRPSTDALKWLLAAQCEDGGWQHTGPQEPNENEHCFTGDANSDFFMSDTDTTSLAVQAAAAHPDTAPFPHSPARFFRTRRDPIKRGWGYDLNYPITNANSTAAAIQAYVALGRRLPDGSMRALVALQYRLCGNRHGAFAYSWEDEDKDGTYTRTRPDVAASIAAIMGLLKRPLPVARAEVTKAVLVCSTG